MCRLPFVPTNWNAAVSPAPKLQMKEPTRPLPKSRAHATASGTSREARVPTGRLSGLNRDGFRPKERACRIDAVDTDVEQWPATPRVIQPDVGCVLDLHGELRGEESRLTQLSASCDIDRFQGRAFEVQSVRNH